MIEVFQLTTTSPTSPSAPQIGTLTGSPVIAPNNSAADFDTPQADGTYAGAVKPGDPVMLTAGNVYDVNPGGGSSVTQVAFYISANGGSSTFSNADTLLGYGTPSTITNASHNWNLTMATSGLSAGDYTIFAVAQDSNGLESTPISWTLTIS